MFEMILDDVAGILRGTFLQGDRIGLFIAFSAVLAAALMMRRSSQVVSMTIVALLLFVVGGFVRAVFFASTMQTTAVQGRLFNQFEASWLQFMNLQAGALLAYFLAFMVLVFFLYAIKSVLARG